MSTKTEKLPPVVYLSVESIIVPADRQRQAAQADDALCQSIDRLGLLNPIIVHSDNTLVAGERRLDAFKRLKREMIPARVFEELPPIARYEAELQENIARKQLTWQEEVKAVGRYHELRATVYPGWTQMGTADALGMSKQNISKVLIIYAERGNADVMSCPTMQGALNLITSRAERAKIAAHNRGLLTVETASLALSIPKDATPQERTAALLANMKTVDVAAKTVDDIDKNLKAIQEGKTAAALLAAQKKLEIANELVICADFLEWAESYEGPKFDVLHIDFPWGKNYSGARTRRTGKTHIAPIYADDPDVYFELVEGFLTLQDRLAFPAAHCLFWFDHLYHDWTRQQFLAAGWDLVQPHPYIWTKGYQGIAADVKRRPRHCYESAFMFVRGDRKIAKLDKDWFDCPVDEKLHLNQKPQEMLKHFLSIFVDEHTAILDPTCGSGSALAAAKLLGASRVLGVELDADNADIAKFMLQRVLGAGNEEAPSGNAS